MKQSWKQIFYTIWVGQAFSQLTSSILQFAMVWYLTDKTKSGMVLSMAMLVGFLPQGLLGPLIGVYIDRLNRKMLMVVSDLVIAGISLLLALISLGTEPRMEWILLVMLIRAIGTAFHRPTLQAITPQLVPKEELTKCSGYTQSLNSISDILSPALAAILYNAWDLSGIILLDVMGAVVAVALLAVCKIPRHDGAGNLEKVHVIREAIEGWNILCSKKGMLGLVLVSSLYTIAMMPVSALFPLMCMGHFGGTSTHASVVEVVFSVGFLMGPFYWGMYTPLLQQTFEARYMGRIMSITGSIRLISGPLSLLVSGRFADRFGTESWFLVAGGIVTVAMLCCALIPAIRNCDKA